MMGWWNQFSFVYPWVLPLLVVLPLLLLMLLQVLPLLL